MNNTILNARTVAIVRDYKEEKKQGANGEYDSKSILVRIATDRPYSVTRTENGKQITERPTDFWLAKFTGSTAETFNKYCSALKEDGKLQSRHLLLSGNFENYQSPRKVSKQVNINGALYNVEFEVEQTNTIFVVDSMEFLDKAPTNANTTATNAVVVTPVATTAPIAQPAVVAPVATQPVAVTAPAVIEQVAQAMATPVATPAEAVPTVPANFVPVGETAPF